MAVTAPEYVEKQSGETRTYTMDFSNLMASDETIASITSVTSELRGGGTTDLTITGEAISSQTVTMKIAGGTDRKVYRIEVTIVTSGTQILIGDGMLRIMDK